MNKINILVAYPYLKKIKEENRTILFEKNTRFLLDSGAFTAWKSGNPISIGEYTDFLHSLPSLPWRYFTLDVIGDGEATRNNYYKLLKEGFKPLPIFTRGEDLEMIDEYFETSDVVGLGGLVGTKGNKGFVKNILEKYPNKKFHLLGFTNHHFISYYEPYMCDSSSLFSAIAFKTARIYLGKGRFLNLKKKDFKSPNEKNKHMLKYDIAPSALNKEIEWVNSGSGKRAIEQINSRSFMRYQKDLEKFKNIKYFIAAGSAWQIRLIKEANHYINKKGY